MIHQPRGICRGGVQYRKANPENGGRSEKQVEREGGLEDGNKILTAMDLLMRPPAVMKTAVSVRHSCIAA